MASLNKVLLMGNLTRNVEVKFAPNGTAICQFGLAVNSRYRQGEEWKEEVCFADIVIFGRQAETAGELLSKGKLVLIEGRLQFQQWEKDGQKRSKHAVIADRWQLVERRETSSAPVTQVSSGNGEEEDIPF